MTWRTLDGQPTRIIAHRGASGYRPEHTLAAYDLGLELGADVIEPDLVICANGSLVVRHDAGLARSTSVASVPAFASRRRPGWDGTEDWWITDFTESDLAQLRARQPFPSRDARWTNLPVPLFRDVLAWMASRRQQRSFALYPEIKHPEEFLAAGLDATARLIDDLRAHQLDGPDSPVWVQCFRMGPLHRVHERIGNPVFGLLESRHVGDPASLRKHAQEHPWLSGHALPKSALFAPEGVDRVALLHDLGQSVHAWTIRDDQVAAGFDNAEAELQRLFSIGVDAVFCDFPDTAIAARRRFDSDPD